MRLLKWKSDQSDRNTNPGSSNIIRWSIDANQRNINRSQQNEIAITIAITIKINEIAIEIDGTGNEHRRSNNQSQWNFVRKPLRLFLTGKLLWNCPAIFCCYLSHSMRHALRLREVFQVLCKVFFKRSGTSKTMIMAETCIKFQRDCTNCSYWNSMK